MGKLVNSIRVHCVSALGNGGWKSIEMVLNMLTLCPQSFNGTREEIDDIFGDDVPNMSHIDKEEIKKRSALIYKWRACRIRTCDPRLRRPLLYPTELRALI